jgi:hypothetical protein
MFKLRDIRARNIHQWRIGLHDPVLDERMHTKIVVLRSDALKVSAREHQRPEVLIDRFQQRLGRRMMQSRSP